MGSIRPLAFYSILGAPEACSPKDFRSISNNVTSNASFQRRQNSAPFIIMQSEFLRNHLQLLPGGASGNTEMPNSMLFFECAKGSGLLQTMKLLICLDSQQRFLSRKAVGNIWNFFSISIRKSSGNLHCFVSVPQKVGSSVVGVLFKLDGLERMQECIFT